MRSEQITRPLLRATFSRDIQPRSLLLAGNAEGTARRTSATGREAQERTGQRVGSQVGKELPEHGEEKSLDSVRQDLCAEAASEQAEDAVLCDDLLCCLDVAYVALVDLAIGLDDSQRVGARVADDGGDEADEGLAGELRDRIVGRRKDFGEVVVGREPREVSDELVMGGREGEDVSSRQEQSKGPERLTVAAAVASAPYHRDATPWSLIR